MRKRQCEGQGCSLSPSQSRLLSTHCAGTQFQFWALPAPSSADRLLPSPSRQGVKAAQWFWLLISQQTCDCHSIALSSAIWYEGWGGCRGCDLRLLCRAGEGDHACPWKPGTGPLSLTGVNLAHQAPSSPTLHPSTTLGRGRSAFLSSHIPTGYWLAQGHQVSCECPTLELDNLSHFC